MVIPHGHGYVASLVKPADLLALHRVLHRGVLDHPHLRYRCRRLPFRMGQDSSRFVSTLLDHSHLRHRRSGCFDGLESHTDSSTTRIFGIASDAFRAAWAGFVKVVSTDSSPIHHTGSLTTCSSDIAADASRRAWARIRQGNLDGLESRTGSGHPLWPWIRVDATPSGIQCGDVALAWLLLEQGTDVRLPLGIVMCSLHRRTNANCGASLKNP